VTSEAPNAYQESVLVSNRRLTAAGTTVSGCPASHARCGEYRVMYVIDGHLITVERVDRVI
jgi:hypothetical protein